MQSRLLHTLLLRVLHLAVVAAAAVVVVVGASTAQSWDGPANKHLMRVQGLGPGVRCQARSPKLPHAKRPEAFVAETL